MPTKLLLIGVLEVILDARIGTGVTDTFALPTRSTQLAWQTSFDINPAAVDIDIDVSLDGNVWTTLDTSTAVGGEVRTITNATAALFIRGFVNTNTGDREVTISLIAKVAVP